MIDRRPLFLAEIAASTPDDLAAAVAIIRRAESLGWMREPSIGNGYALYLYEDARAAAAYLATPTADREPDHQGFTDTDANADAAARQMLAEIIDLVSDPADLEPDSDRCDACGALAVCDCAVYLVS